MFDKILYQIIFDVLKLLILEFDFIELWAICLVTLSLLVRLSLEATFFFTMNYFFAAFHWYYW